MTEAHGGYYVPHSSHWPFVGSVGLFVFLLGVVWAPAHAVVCDVDSDGDVDRVDISLLFAARNAPASGPDDPRDADGNGTITVLDGRHLLQRHPQCL